MINLKKILKETLVFRKLSEHELEKLCGFAVKKDLEKGQIISLSDQLFPYVFIVEQGTVQSVKESEKGSVLILRTMSKGDVFWGHALIDGGPTPGTLKAVEKSTRVYMWHKKHLRLVLDDNAEALWEVSAALMGRMRGALTTIEQLAFHDVMTRLARLLLEEYNAYQNCEDYKVPRNLTLEEIAARIGTAREVVCRLLYRLDDDGFVDITRTHFIIKDIQSLKLLAREY